MMDNCALVRKELQSLIQLVEKMALAMDQGYDFPPMPLEGTLQSCFLAFETLPIRDRLKLQPDWAELMIGLQRLEQKTAYALKQKKESIIATRSAFKALLAYTTPVNSSDSPSNTDSSDS